MLWLPANVARGKGICSREMLCVFNAYQQRLVTAVRSSHVMHRRCWFSQVDRVNNKALLLTIASINLLYAHNI